MEELRISTVSCTLSLILWNEVLFYQLFLFELEHELEHVPFRFQMESTIFLPIFPIDTFQSIAPIKLSFTTAMLLDLILNETVFNMSLLNKHKNFLKNKFLDT